MRNRTFRWMIPVIKREK